jgi:beta-glucosidase
MCALGLFAAFAPAGRTAAARCPWLRAGLAPEARASLLLGAMSMSEKLALLSGVDVTDPLYAPLASSYVGYVPAQPELCIPSLTLNDGGAGVADGQLGTTAFPAPIDQAAMWDPTQARRLGQALGNEAWRKGIDVLLGPDVNIARVPENGRNFEAFGEDPFLAAQTAVAEIEGIQRNPVIATVKHFPVNSQETNRWYLSSNLDQRTLHEIYLPPFEAAVEQAHVGAVMCAYGSVNATFSCEDRSSLTAILRDTWGFDGFVMSDWRATHSTVNAANSGLDLEMPTGLYFGQPLAEAVAAGKVSADRINLMTLGILESMFAEGVFQHPPPAGPTLRLANVSTAAHRRLARRVAEEGAVLLKNTPGVLPLQAATQPTIAVVGAPAGAPNIAPYLSGGGSGYVAATDPVTPLQALTSRAARAGATVAYADGADPAAAAAVAAQAAVAIVFAYDVEAEGADRPTLALPNGQDQLIEQVAAANPRTVVVLQTGGPVLMPWLDQVAAVLETWYPGQEAGAADAALLFGDVNPSGKLPQTFPTSDAAVPAADPSQWPGANNAQDAAFSEGLNVGYRWYDRMKVAPLFAFGYGLSYTTFAYSHLRLQRTQAGLSVSFTVRNTGSRNGVEVAQVYVDDPPAAHEPPKQLVGFRRVFLRSGASARVTLTLTSRAFSQWSPARSWTVAPGLYRVLVGSSSRDIRLGGLHRE